MASSFKAFFLFSLLLLAVAFGYFWFDDSLNPKAEYWIKHYQTEVNTDHNAFIYLIGLNNDNNKDPFRSGLSKYQKQVDMYQDSFIDLTKKLSYPDPQILPEAETDPLLCNLNEPECISLLRENMEEVEALVTYYQPLLSQFHRMASLSNFSFINTELTQANFVFNTLSRIAALDTLVAIWQRDYEKANHLLASQVAIERTLMTHAFTVEFKIFPLIHIKTLYQPLITLLVEQHKADTARLEKVLFPLSAEEFSFQTTWMKLFTDNLSLLTDDSLYQDFKAGYPEYSFLPLRLLYKESMTLNAIFKHHHINAQVRLVPKRTLLQRLENHNKKAAQRQDMEINYRNFIGSVLVATSAPKYLDLNNDLIEFDRRLSLLRLLINSQEDSMDALISEQDYRDPYSEALPALKGKQLCYPASNENTCIAVH